MACEARFGVVRRAIGVRVVGDSLVDLVGSLS